MVVCYVHAYAQLHTAVMYVRLISFPVGLFLPRLFAFLVKRHRETSQIAFRSDLGIGHTAATVRKRKATAAGNYLCLSLLFT